MPKSISGISPINASDFTSIDSLATSRISHLPPLTTPFFKPEINRGDSKLSKGLDDRFRPSFR